MQGQGWSSTDQDSGSRARQGTGQMRGREQQGTGGDGAWGPGAGGAEGEGRAGPPGGREAPAPACWPAGGLGPIGGAAGSLVRIARARRAAGRVCRPRAAGAGTGAVPEARPIVPPPALPIVPWRLRRARPCGGGAARAAASVAAMDLGGCPGSPVPGLPGPHPAAGDRAVLSGPGPRGSSGAGRGVGGPGVLGERGSGGRALAPTPPRLGRRLATRGAFPRERPSGCEVRVPASGPGSCTCFGTCWARGRAGESRLPRRCHLLNV